MRDFGHPDNVNVLRDTHGGDTVVQFLKDGAESVVIRLTSSSLLTFVSLLHEKIERSPLAPVSVSQLRPGVVFETKGVLAKRQPDGGLRLVLTVEMDDRVVQIPLDLDRPTWRQVMREMEG